MGDRHVATKPLAMALFESEGGLRGWLVAWHIIPEDERQKWRDRAADSIHMVEAAGFRLVAADGGGADG